MSAILPVSMHRRAGTKLELSLNMPSISMRSTATSVAASTESFISTTTTLSLAPDRWSIEKRRQEWEEELEVFRFKQKQKMRYIQLVSDHRARMLHEKIFFSVRWANPPLSSAVEKLIFEYCDHLLGPEPELVFPGSGLLKAWSEKYRATEHEKAYQLVYALCTRLHSLTTRRDKSVVKTHAKMENTTVKMEYRKHSDLQWRTHQLKGQRDRYWTIWYLAANNMHAELKRLLDESPQPKAPARFLAVRSQMSISGDSLKSRHEVLVDESDPDFGFTALHYAAQKGNVEIIKLLMSYDANVNVTTPDGRTPLHLAAAYATKATVLELLAVGADYFCCDNYSCTALDLARQNGNQPTLKALLNWTNLVPAVEEIQEEEDLSDIPLEFLSTPLPVFELMSYSLQMLCRRLDSNESDPSQVIRLCQRHSLMCLEEGFDKEGVKSALRRWSIAKKLYNDKKQRSETFQNEASVVLPETSISDSAVRHALDIPVNNNNSTEDTPENILQQTLPEYTEEGQEIKQRVSDESSAVENMFSESQGYFIPDGEEGERIRQISDAIIMRKLKRVRSSQKEKTEKVDINGVSLSEIGRDLSERLIMDGQERFAMSILLECATLDGLEPTTVIAILARYCETGLVVIDLLAKLLASRLEYRGRGMKEHKLATDMPALKSVDLFESSEIVTYFNTVKRHREGTSAAIEENKLSAERREVKARAVNASRHDIVTEKLLYRLGQRSVRRLANKWIPRPYGDPVFKTENALDVNAKLKEANVDPFHEPLPDDNLICEEKIMYSLERHVEIVVEAAEFIVKIHEHLDEGFIVESCTLVPLLELASYARERRADLVDFKDTLTFIQEQEATGLWDAPAGAVAQDFTLSDFRSETKSMPLPHLPGADSISAVIADLSAEECNALSVMDNTKAPSFSFVLTDRLRQALDVNFWEFRFNDFDAESFGEGISLDEILDSLRKMKRAAVVSERTLGVASEETLRILLEVLRILTRASCWTPASALLFGGEKNANLEMMPGSSEIYEFAKFLSKKLDVLGLVNPIAVDGLVKKYSDLLSLSRLFQESGGTTLPELSAPHSTSRQHRTNISELSKKSSKRRGGELNNEAVSR